MYSEANPQAVRTAEEEGEGGGGVSFVSIFGSEGEISKPRRDVAIRVYEWWGEPRVGTSLLQKEQVCGEKVESELERRVSPFEARAQQLGRFPPSPPSLFSDPRDALFFKQNDPRGL